MPRTCNDLKMYQAASDDPWHLREALAGDQEAWAGIVDAFYRQIWHWARGCGLTREDAEDVSQIVWCRLKDKGDKILEPAGLPGWLATTTRREAIATKTRRDRESAPDYGLDHDVPVLPFLSAGVASPEEEALVGDMRRRLATAYGTLTPSCREVLALCWSGLSHQEVAQTLGRPLGYIGPTRGRCLQALRRNAGIDG